MGDMLVKLYELPPLAPKLEPLAKQGIVVRRAIAPERDRVLEWVKDFFSVNWRSETAVAFAHVPVGCFIAVKDDDVLGFADYDATLRGFFGPTGVDEKYRGKGIGTALILACMHAMRSDGYGYAVIGGAGPTEFYEKTVGAVAIEGSKPGIYKGAVYKRR